VDVVALLAILIILCAVVALVGAPLRRSAADASGGSARDDRLTELRARKEAKYREIRDAEMDLRTGKLSQEDHRLLERQLRAEAIEILKAVDECEEEER
jgi:hypothetical protein